MATTYQFGLAVILLGAFATVNLICLANPNSPTSNKEVFR